jgi:hypothetical protein
MAPTDNKAPAGLKPVLLATVLAFLAVHVPATLYFLWVGKPVAATWAEHFKPAAPGHRLGFYTCPSPALTKKTSATIAKPGPDVTKAPSTCADTPPITQDFLVELRAEAIQLTRASIERLQSLFAWQYLALIAGLVAAALSAIWTFMFAASGWSNTEPWVKAAFAVTSTSLAFWLTVPQVFRYQDNIVAAERIFHEGSALRREIETFASTGKGRDGAWIEPAAFAWQAHAQLREIRRIGIAFDQARVGIPTPSALGSGR